jgi:hypothetical protein
VISTGLKTVNRKVKQILSEGGGGYKERIKGDIKEKDVGSEFTCDMF